MEQPTRDQITEALGKVIDPELKRPVTELDMVREVRVDGSHIAVTIALTVVGCPLRSSFETQVREHLLPLPGIESKPSRPVSIARQKKQECLPTGWFKNI